MARDDCAPSRCSATPATGFPSASVTRPVMLTSLAVGVAELKRAISPFHAVTLVAVHMVCAPTEPKVVVIRCPAAEVVRLGVPALRSACLIQASLFVPVFVNPPYVPELDVVLTVKPATESEGNFVGVTLPVVIVVVVPLFKLEALNGVVVSIPLNS